MPSSPAMVSSCPLLTWNSDSTSREAPSRRARSANWRNAKAVNSNCSFNSQVQFLLDGDGQVGIMPASTFTVSMNKEERVMHSWRE